MWKWERGIKQESHFISIDNHKFCGLYADLEHCISFLLWSKATDVSSNTAAVVNYLPAFIRDAWEEFSDSIHVYT